MRVCGYGIFLRLPNHMKNLPPPTKASTFNVVVTLNFVPYKKSNAALKPEYEAVFVSRGR